MHATTMHFAFLSSKSVNTKTPLGQRILKIAVAHHEQMEKELKEKQEAEAARKKALEEEALRIVALTAAELT